MTRSQPFAPPTAKAACVPSTDSARTGPPVRKPRSVCASSQRTARVGYELEHGLAARRGLQRVVLVREAMRVQQGDVALADRRDHRRAAVLQRGDPDAVARAVGGEAAGDLQRPGVDRDWQRPRMDEAPGRAEDLQAVGAVGAAGADEAGGRGRRAIRGHRAARRARRLRPCCARAPDEHLAARVRAERERDGAALQAVGGDLAGDRERPGSGGIGVADVGDGRRGEQQRGSGDGEADGYTTHGGDLPAR